MPQDQRLTGRWTLDAYADEFTNGSIAAARKYAKAHGLIVHANRAGYEFVSSPDHERQYPLNPQN